jgi:hypothetical protein
MRPMRVSILGSCVTRDIFRVAPGDFEVVSYHCRTSLVSLMSPPLELDERGLAWSSPFPGRVVRADFEKTFFGSLVEAAPDLLLLDLVEERHDLLRRGESFAAHSRDLIDAGFHPDGFEVLSRFRPDVEALWYPAARRFAETLKARFPDLPVVLHRAFGLTSFRDNGAVRAFPDRRRRVIDVTNRMLRRFYAHLAADLPRAIILELPQTFAADAAHRWGLAPYHYEDAYYLEAMNHLDAVVQAFSASTGSASTASGSSAAASGSSSSSSSTSPSTGTATARFP